MRWANLATQIRLLGLGVSGIVVLLGVTTFILVIQRPLPKQASLSPAPGLQATLNSITVHILAYLQDRDPQHLESIRTLGDRASSELKRFSATLPTGARGLAESNYETLRQATVAILEADASVTESLERYERAHDRFTRVLKERLMPRLKPLQLGFSGRQRAFLELQSAGSEMSNALNTAISGQAMPDPNVLVSVEAAFHVAANRWSDAGRFGPSVRGPEESRAAFQTALRYGRRVIRDENVRRTTIQQYMETFRIFEEGLRLQAANPAPMRAPVSKWPLALGALFLAFLGAAGMYWADRLFTRNVITPLKQLLKSTDAAATGDLSRLPELWSRDEVGQLSQALGRLITVLARSENLVYHLASLVELSGDAIISQTLDGTILSWNKGAQRIYGYSAEEVKGLSISVLSPDDEGAMIKDVLGRLQAGEKVQPFETLHKAKNGRTVQAFVRVAAILDSTHQVIGASFCAQELPDKGIAAPQSQDALPENV